MEVLSASAYFLGVRCLLVGRAWVDSQIRKNISSFS